MFGVTVRNRFPTLRVQQKQRAVHDRPVLKVETQNLVRQREQMNPRVCNVTEVPPLKWWRFL